MDHTFSLSLYNSILASTTRVLALPKNNNDNALSLLFKMGNDILLSVTRVSNGNYLTSDK